jgi:peroxiredoxin (alkyl hydroperoxide reductase subunit C)
MGVMTLQVSRNVAELIRQVKAFQHVRETGEVMPSGWQPGRSTLKPGPGLAGKVWEVRKTDSAFRLRPDGIEGLVGPWGLLP